MLAARDQESLVYSHQTNAASKPLKQGIRATQSKTPGQRAPKTPFRAWLNDENNPTAFGGQPKAIKALGKGDENGLQPIGKAGKLNSNAFITPMGKEELLSHTYLRLTDVAGPRVRAPLGIKTTNTKAIQTPAPLQTTKPEKTLKQVSTGRKSAKSKIRIAPSEPVDADILSRDADLEVPEVEYCPPPPIELPDPPEEITYDDSFPYLRGSNLCAGYSDVYDVPRDEHGVSLRERKEEETHARMLQQIEDKLREEIAKPWPLDDEDDIVEATIAAGHRTTLNNSSNIATARAKGAISALSSRPQTRLPSVATKETASSIQKKKPSSSLAATKTSILQPTNQHPMRHNAAVAASKTTIGYSKGRNVSANFPQKTVRALPGDTGKIDQSKIDPGEFRELYGERPVGSKMWYRFREHGIFDEEHAGDDDDLAGLIWGSTSNTQCEDEEEIFQLPMPEEI